MDSPRKGFHFSPPLLGPPAALSLCPVCQQFAELASKSLLLWSVEIFNRGI
jgi:hypothetical protein